MTLAANLRALRDRVLAELIAVHDYYADALTAWLLVREVVQAGATFSNLNGTTGTVTTQTDLAARALKYAEVQLAQATFPQFIAIFESFFLDLLRLWLLAYPQTLGSRKVDFKDILDAPDKDALALLVVNKEINELLYQRPRDWFAYLESRGKLGCPTPDEIDHFAEAKASRDLFIHNRGVANKIYEYKAGKLARYQIGEIIDIPEQYHRETWELLRKLVADLSDAALAKAP